MKRLWVLLCVVALPGCNSVQDVTVKGAGIFEYQKIKEVKADQTATGEYVQAGRMVLVKRTNQIPQRKGIKFGIRFVINGPSSGKKISTTIRLLHPKITSPKTGKASTVSSYKTEHTIGKIHHVGYGYDTEGSMPPGKYVFQILHKDKKILEQVFLVNRS
jgi:hypothetical protein